jgi:hypothetical protein
LRNLQTDRLVEFFDLNQLGRNLPFPRTVGRQYSGIARATPRWARLETDMKKFGVALLLTLLISSPCWADDGEASAASAIWQWVLSLLPGAGEQDDSSIAAAAPATGNFYGYVPPNG